MGAEVVTADIDDLQSVKKALDGAYGAFFVTFFWEHFSPEKEMAQAKNLADAAKAVGLKHAIWSTLEDVRTFVPLDDDRIPTMNEKYKVPHFDGKGASNQYFADVPTTYLLTSFYWDNLIYFGMGPKPGPDGKMAITFPMGDKKMACIAAADIGKCAYGIFKKGDALIGKTVGIAGDKITCADMAKALSRAIGKEVVYNEVTPDVYRSFDFPGADDLGSMFQFFRDFDTAFNGIRDLNVSKELNPDLQSFDMWLAENAKRIPLD
jgi:uncharacterized protein YbjT (DUF2867 family)